MGVAVGGAVLVPVYVSINLATMRVQFLSVVGSFLLQPILPVEGCSDSLARKD